MIRLCLLGPCCAQLSCIILKGSRQSRVRTARAFAMSVTWHRDMYLVYKQVPCTSAVARLARGLLPKEKSAKRHEKAGTDLFIGPLPRSNSETLTATVAWSDRVMDKS